MEPGHEDREYVYASQIERTESLPQWSPVMKTGNTGGIPSPPATPICLNGARS